MSARLVRSIIGAALVVLSVLLLVGTNAVLASVIAVAALAVAVAAMRQNRLDRAEYEAGLTRWAAAEAVLAERVRIARDLHDIVSHGLGLITVRAAATRHVARSGSAADVAEMHSALADIEEAGRRATDELRRMLTVLRTAADPPPVDGLDQLPAIVGDLESAGLRTRLVVGEVGEVSRGVQVAVCRVVREALTNVARHAGPADVRVDVGREADVVLVTVTDDGPSGSWRAAPGAGHGLAGLRERVGALGGELHAGRAGAGFRLSARIPDQVAG
jgi:two-component system sensor histidine kinase DesK